MTAKEVRRDEKRVLFAVVLGALIFAFGLVTLPVGGFVREVTLLAVTPRSHEVKVVRTVYVAKPVTVRRTVSSHKPVRSVCVVKDLEWRSCSCHC